MSALWAVLLLVVVLMAWGSTLLGLPGNWLIVAVVGLYVALKPEDSAASIGWPVVVVLLLLAVLAEVGELLAGAWGAAKLGGSRRASLLALGGSMVGGLVGVLVGLPVPLIGPILAAVLFAALGALLGAMLGESWRGRSLPESWQIGKAAFRGRLLGTLVKALIGLAMAGIVVLALLF